MLRLVNSRPNRIKVWLGLAFVAMAILAANIAAAIIGAGRELTLILSLAVVLALILVTLKLVVMAVLDIERQGGRTERVDSRLKGSEERLDRTEHRLAAFEAKLDSARMTLQSTSQDLTETRQSLQEARDSASNEHARLREIRSDLEQSRRLAASLDKRTSETSRRLDMDHRAWSLALARRDSTGEFPPRVLLLVTIQRTGSTRLFDILRSHPGVYVEPLNIVWEELGLVGRRYPTGLSDRPGASLPIEVQPGVGANLPSVNPPDRRGIDQHDGLVAVEKTHPQFFDFDAMRLSMRIHTVTTALRCQIDLLYLIRDPLDVMWSMVEYMRRDKAWYKHLADDEVPGFVQRSQGALADLHQMHPGMVMDYTSIAENSPEMRQLGQSIDPNMDQSEIKVWLEKAFAATDRSKLESSLFVGDRDAERNITGPEGQWRHQRQTIEATQRTYEELLDGA